MLLIKSSHPSHVLPLPSLLLSALQRWDSPARAFPCPCCLVCRETSASSTAGGASQQRKPVAVAAQAHAASSEQEGRGWKISHPDLMRDR